MGKCSYNNERERPVREQLHADDAQLRLRDREDGGGLRGPRRAHGPGRDAARHRLGQRVNLYVPAPRLSLCRHAEQGCGVAAKKSPVAAKKPVYKRTTIVDETSLLGVTAVLGGGGASLRTRDQGLGQGQGGLISTFDTQANFFLLHFLLHIYNCGCEARMQGIYYNYEFCGQPRLGRTSFKTIIVIYYVMSVKIASLVAGNVVTFLQP